MPFADIVTDMFGVEKHPFAHFIDLFHDAVGVCPSFKLRGQFAVQVGIDIRAVFLPPGVEEKGAQPLQRHGDSFIPIPAGNDQAQPHRGLAEFPGDEICQVVYLAAARLIKGIDEDHNGTIRLADPRQRLRNQVVKGGVGIVFGQDLHIGQPGLIFRQLGAQLIGDGGHHCTRIALLGMEEVA